MSFTTNILSCVNQPPIPNFSFPDIDAPGLPNLLSSVELSFLAGIDYFKSFLPPDPSNLPELPSLSMFLSPFLSIKIPHPEIPILGNITLPALTVPNLTIPDPQFPEINIPFPYDQFDPSGAINLIKGFILFPFKVITNIVQSIIELNFTLPSLSSLLDLVASIFKDIGIALPDPFPSLSEFPFPTSSFTPEIGMAQLLFCIVTGVVGLLSI